MSIYKRPTLIIIVGPTGIGKTSISIEIASKLETEIISCDSRQIFREMCIGTAVPSQEQLKLVPHHFIHSSTIHDNYNASIFEEAVLSLLVNLFKKHNSVIMCGGSMLYIDAVCNGIDDLPTIDEKIRADLLSRYEIEGIEPLRFELKRIDPDYYAIADLKNYKRIVHALEVYYMTGKPYSHFRTNSKKERPFDIIKIGLDRDRKELHNIINSRVDKMIECGLEHEARNLHQYKGINSLNTVGYRELFDYFDGQITIDEAIELIKRNSRRYARRQLTWFRRDKEIRWFEPDNRTEIMQYVIEKINSKN